MPEEEYKRLIEELRNQISQKQDEIVSLNNRLRDEKTAQQNQIHKLELQIRDKQGEVDNINNARNTDRNNLNHQIQIKDQEINTIRSDYDKRIDTLKREIELIKSQLENKEKEVNVLEKQLIEKDKEFLNKLSDSYERQSNAYLTEQEKWKIQVILAFVILVLTVGFSILIHLWLGEKIGLSIDQKLAFYTIDFVAISYLWFTISQYSYTTKLTTDYTNRKTVSYAFLSFIHAIKDETLKEKVATEISNTLFSRSTVEMGNELPVKESLKVVSDAVNSAKDMIKKT